MFNQYTSQTARSHENKVHSQHLVIKLRLPCFNLFLRMIVSMVTGQHRPRQGLGLHARTRRQRAMALLPELLQPELRVRVPDGCGGELRVSVP